MRKKGFLIKIPNPNMSRSLSFLKKIPVIPQSDSHDDHCGDLDTNFIFERDSKEGKERSQKKKKKILKQGWSHRTPKEKEASLEGVQKQEKNK